MNNKGQLALLGLMVGIVVIMFGLIAINPINDVLDEVKGASQLDCSNSSIGDSQKATCLGVDILMPYYIGIIIVAGGAWITAKWVAS